MVPTAFKNIFVIPEFTDAYDSQIKNFYILFRWLYLEKQVKMS